MCIRDSYSILYDVVDSDFPLEVAVEDQEAFVKNLLPLVDNVYSIYDLTDDDLSLIHISLLPTR